MPSATITARLSLAKRKRVKSISTVSDVSHISGAVEEDYEYDLAIKAQETQSRRMKKLSRDEKEHDGGGDGVADHKIDMGLDGARSLDHERWR